MAHPAKKRNGKYSYGDYLSWPPDERWELIDGAAYNMTPAPSRGHQKVLIALLNEFYNYLKGKTCEVYSAPFDVRLPEGDEKDDDIKTVVQPDIVVICDKSRLDDKGCKGKPVLIVEVVSPSTAAKDYMEKLALYEKHGVKEYWIAHPTDEIIMVYRLTENKNYGRAEIYSKDSKVTVGIFDDLTINLKDVFRE